MREDKAAIMTITDVLEATGGDLVCGRSLDSFAGVSTDSRTLGAGNLFVCLRGEHFDGHLFLEAAAAKGAAGFVVQSDAIAAGFVHPGNMPVVCVADTLVALGEIAHFWRKKLKTPVIGVTGSAGKTTTKEMIAAILSLTHNTLKTEGNLNNRIGVPLTLLRLTPGHDVAVVEMGTNMPGEIGCLTRIAAPNIALITNVGAAHLEKLKSIANVAKEKGALFENMNPDGVAVVNCDDKSLDSLGRRLRGRKVTFGRKHAVDVYAYDIKNLGPVGTGFHLKVGKREMPIMLQVSGEHNVQNALAAAAAAFTFGADLQTIRRGLESFGGVAGRFEIRPLQNGAYLIDDTYNANPSSASEALKALRELCADGDSTAVLGDMLELGSRADQWHRKTGQLVASSGIKNLLLMGEYASNTAAGAMEKGMAASRIFIFETHEQILAHLQASVKAKDWVLVKGSRKMKMERIVQILTETCGRKEHGAA